VTELEVRVGQLIAILDGIQRDLSTVQERVEVLAASDTADELARSLAGDALERHDALNDRVNAITLAVAEGIQHVDRAEKRIRATVQRAQRELRESGEFHPGVEAEASQLRLVYGDGGDEGGMPPVRADVEGAQPTRAEQIRERLKQLKLSS
jgi:hypothetical protein